MRFERAVIGSGPLVAEVAAAGVGRQGHRGGRERFLASLPGSPNVLDWIRARADVKRFGGPLARPYLPGLQSYVGLLCGGQRSAAATGGGCSQCPSGPRSKVDSFRRSPPAATVRIAATCRPLNS